MASNRKKGKTPFSEHAKVRILMENENATVEVETFIRSRRLGEGLQTLLSQLHIRREAPRKPAGTV